MIGSMPGTDPGAIAQAVMEVSPHLPAVPELIDLHPGASLVGRLCLALGWDPYAAIDAVTPAAAGSLDPEVPLAVGIDPDADAGLIGLSDALGSEADTTIKVQILGPITAEILLVRAGVDGVVARRLAARLVHERSVALIDWLADRHPLVTPLVVFDEPGLVTLTSTEPEMGLVDVVDVLSSAVASVQPVAMSGIHCCGPTDWPLVFQTGTDVVSAPIGAGVEAYPAALSAFLVRDGWMCWGAVPTRRPLGPNGELSWKRLADNWCGLVRDGVNPLRLRTQALVSPECGLAGHGETQAAHVLEVVARLGERVHEQVVAVRFAVGA